VTRAEYVAASTRTRRVSRATSSLKRVSATVAVGALAGFGGTPRAAEKKTPAVCKLLTTREAAEILGTEAGTFSSPTTAC
jgi:hypothetical protein